jgi:cobaltochelatase CobN
MLDAERKGYWQTDDETLKKLVQTYLEIKQEHNVINDNKKILKVLSQCRSRILVRVLLVSEKALAQKIETVEGKKLERIEPKPSVDNQWNRYGVALFLLLAFVWGSVNAS